MFRDSDDRIGQPRIASDTPPLHFNSGLDTSHLCVSYGLVSRDASLCFGWRQCTMGGMWSELIMPTSISIESSLNGLPAQRHRRSTHPSLHILEDPLDLGVELPCADLAADVRHTKRLYTRAESRPELAAVIGHQKPWRCPTALDRRLDQLHQILRSWSTAIRLHRDDLPAESVDDGRNLDLLPEYPDLSHVQMPHLVRLRGMSHVCRRHCHTNVCVLFRRARRTLLKYTSNRSPAHTNPSSHDVPRDRPCPELRLWEGLTDLVDQSADTVVESIPGRATEQLFRPQLVMNSPLPVADRVGMYDETGTDLFGRPSPELHDFKDLRTLGGRVVRALVRGLPLSLGSENCQLPLEQRSVVIKSVPLPKQPDQRRGVPKHSGSGRHRSVHKGSSNTLYYLPHRPIFAHFNTPTTMSGSAQADNHKHLQYKCFRRQTTPESRTHRTSSGRRTNSWPTPVRADWRAPRLVG